MASAAAAEVYFGKTLDQLSVAEMATLAGIPEGAVADQSGRERARPRVTARAYVLRRMLELALHHPGRSTMRPTPARSSRGCTARRSRSMRPTWRKWCAPTCSAKYGDDVYTAGYKVYTTIDSRLQAAATVSLRTGLLEYDRRHGFRGATAKVDLAKNPRPGDLGLRARSISRRRRLAAGDRRRRSRQERADLRQGSLGRVTLPWEKMSWARRELPDEKVDRVADPGGGHLRTRRRDLYGRHKRGEPAVRPGARGAERARRDGSEGRRRGRAGRRLRFLPEQIQPRDPGEAPAGVLVQAVPVCGGVRQGFTPASVVLDAPVVLDRPKPDQAWRPQDSSGEKFFGPMRLREALVQSRNLVSVRLLQRHRPRIHPELRDALRLRQIAAPRRPDARDRHRRGEPAADGDRLLDVRQRRLQGELVLHRPRSRTRRARRCSRRNRPLACFECNRDGNRHPPRRTARPLASAVAAQGSSLRLGRGVHDGKTVLPAKDMAPQVLRPQVAYLLADMMADVIRRGTGVRARAVGARRHRRQDRHHERRARRLVFRIQRRSGHDRLGGVRPGPLARKSARRAGAPPCRSGLISCARPSPECPGMPCPCPTASSRRVSILTTGLLGERRRSEIHHGEIHRGQFAEARGLRRPELDESDDTDGDKPLF